MDYPNIGLFINDIPWINPYIAFYSWTIPLIKQNELIEYPTIGNIK